MERMDRLREDYDRVYAHAVALSPGSHRLGGRGGPGPGSAAGDQTAPRQGPRRAAGSGGRSLARATLPAPSVRGPPGPNRARAPVVRTPMSARGLVNEGRRRLALGTRYRALEESVLQGRYAHWRTLPVLDTVVLYESFSGNGMLCNPEAIFRHLLDAPDRQHLEHVWVLRDFAGYRTSSPSSRHRGSASSRYGPATTPGAGHLAVPGQQRDVPAAVRQAGRADLRQHLARHPVEEDGVRRGERRPGHPQHHPQLPRRRLPAVRQRLHDPADVRDAYSCAASTAADRVRRATRAPTGRPGAAEAAGRSGPDAAPARGGDSARSSRSSSTRRPGRAVPSTTPEQRHGGAAHPRPMQG